MRPRTGFNPANINQFGRHNRNLYSKNFDITKQSFFNEFLNLIVLLKSNFKFLIEKSNFVQKYFHLEYLNFLIMTQLLYNLAERLFDGRDLKG